MVLLHYKKSENDQFIAETKTTVNISEAKQLIIRVNNLRLKLDQLFQAVEGLMSHGPLKPEALRGLNTPETILPAIEMLPKEQKKWVEVAVTADREIKEDKNAQRCGVAPTQEIADKCMNSIAEYRRLLSPELAKRRKVLKPEQLEEAIEMLRAAVMIVYPAYHTLPPWEPCVRILEEKIEYEKEWVPLGYKVPDTTSMWWAKKELIETKTLAEYVGKNEKSKVIVKLAGKGKGAPMAEAPIDAETQKKMMAFYHKKQEEMKRLENQTGDEYMYSSWANSNSLKNELHRGSNGIRFK